MTDTKTRSGETKSATGRRFDPIATLETEHTQAMEYIDSLEDSARSIRQRGFTATSFEAISEKSGMLEEIFREHDVIEEKHLFPFLEKFGPEYARQFRDEHRATRRLFSTLRTLVQNLEQGRIHGTSVGDLLRTTQDIVRVLRRHIEVENDILFPLIRQRLAPEEIESLKQSMRDPDGPVRIPGNLPG